MAAPAYGIMNVKVNAAVYTVIIACQAPHTALLVQVYQVAQVAHQIIMDLVVYQHMI